MTNPPFFYLQVWRGRDEILACVLDMPMYMDALKHDFKLWSFAGRVATVCCVTDDKSITREDCLRWATRFVKGDYQTISVDLDKLEATATRGQPTPRY